jgi:hypothetical protein
LEQFGTTESWAWASVINSYSLAESVTLAALPYSRKLRHHWKQEQQIHQWNKSESEREEGTVASGQRELESGKCPLAAIQ